MQGLCELMHYCRSTVLIENDWLRNGCAGEIFNYRSKKILTVGFFFTLVTKKAFAQEPFCEFLVNTFGYSKAKNPLDD